MKQLSLNFNKIMVAGVLFTLVAISLSTVMAPQLATTLSICKATASAIVYYVNAALDVVAVVSLIGIIVGVGGFNLALIQTIRGFIAKKGLAFTATW